MIIYLTNTHDQEVAVNLNMVTYMEEHDDDDTEINFSGEAIYVKETIYQIRKNIEIEDAKKKWKWKN